MTIELASLELFGYHGVLSEEREQGQRFLVDVCEVSEGRAYHLLEAFASALAGTLLERFPLVRARVRVRKPDVRLDLPVEYAAVEVDLPLA